MNIDHLHTFLEVVATGSFHRAADNLNVTQSTVSARIRALEERLDRRLFLRHKHGVEVTGAGRRLRRHADAVVRAWEQGRQRVALPEGCAVFSASACTPIWPIGWRLIGSRRWPNRCPTSPSTSISITPNRSPASSRMACSIWSWSLGRGPGRAW